MSELLDRIDAAIGGLCPCGAESRPESIYCGYDCEPTHIAAETDRRQFGEFATPMRWRAGRAVAYIDPVPANRAVATLEQVFRGVAAAFEQAFRDIQPAFERFLRLSQEMTPEPKHPMLQVIEARRNRNTGPVERRRAPRQIRPSRRR